MLSDVWKVLERLLPRKWGGHSEHAHAVKFHLVLQTPKRDNHVSDDVARTATSSRVDLDGTYACSSAANTLCMRDGSAEGHIVCDCVRRGKVATRFADGEGLMCVSINHVFHFQCED